jgi:hypothetical protein
LKTFSQLTLNEAKTNDLGVIIANKGCPRESSKLGAFFILITKE